MELMLRPPRPRFHPLLLRRGMRGIGQTAPYINPTTIWTPQTGYLAETGTLEKGYQFQPQVTSVYDVPGLLLSAPQCTQDNGGAYVSPECVDIALAVQQENFQRIADYNTGILEHVRTAPVAPPPPPGSVVNYSGAALTTAPVTASGPAGAAQFSFTNLTSGDNATFKVGDRWEIRISGATPNAPVSVNGGLNGANVLTQMGNTDASGRFTLNGQMEQSQVGSWIEAWRVNNQIIASFSFRVSPAGSVVDGGPVAPAAPPRTTTTTSFTDVLSSMPGGSVEIGGMEIPWMALGIGAIALLLVIKK
jgi:hypothetical protein